METKSLLIGITSFIAGGLLVSIAATTFEKDKVITNSESTSHTADSLKNKSGDEFDKEFLSEMIVHHEGAIDMAKLADKQAKHPEVKDLSKAITAAQEKEIKEMKQWQLDWGYKESTEDHPTGH